MATITASTTIEEGLSNPSSIVVLAVINPSSIVVLAVIVA
jgi:hypothetical protein